MQQMSISTANPFLATIKSDIIDQMLDLIKRDNAGCNPKLIQGGTGPSLNISLKFQLGRRCDLYNVTETIIDLTDITTIDTLNNTILDISLNLDENCENKWRPVSNPVLINDCAVTIRFNNSIACSQIELLISELDAFSYEHEAGRAVFLAFFGHNSTRVTVCVDEYLKQMALVAGGCCSSDHLKIFYLVSMLLHVMIRHLVALLQV